MTNSNLTQRLADLWSSDDMRFEAKAQDVAIALASAVHQAGLTRAQLAGQLGWKPSRVTKVLTGSENLTLRTIHQICSALGLEFDLVLRGAGECAQVLDERRAALMIREIDDNLRKSRALLAAAQSVHQRGWQQARNTRRFNHCELLTKVAA